MSNKDNTNLAVNQTFCEDQNNSKNIFFEKDSNNYNIRQNEADNRNTIYLHDDFVWKSFICDGEV